MARRKSILTAPWRSVLWLPKGLLATLVLLLLVLNVATLMAPAAFNGVSGLLESVVGQRTVRSDLESRATALRTENVGLGQRIAALEADAAAFAELQAAVAEAVTDLGARAEAQASRTLAALPGEALPYLGLAAVTASAAQDVADACATMDDLATLASAASVDPAPDPATVCALAVPAPAETWAAASAEPQSTWSALKAIYPDLPEPALWNVYALSLQRGAERYLDWLGAETAQ